MSLSIAEHFSVLVDPRQQGKIEHSLNDILILCISAVICGAEGWQDIRTFGLARLEWLKRLGGFENGIPADDTLARVVSCLNPKQLQACFTNWMQAAQAGTQGQVVAVDGKTVRRSFDRKNRKSAIHMVSAFACHNGVVLGQRKTEEKSNEITAIPELLDLLELKGCIVTIDAMGCQEKIARKVVEKGADYVLAVKGNQGELHKEVVDFFAWARERQFAGVAHDYHESCDKGHGRIEIRRTWITQALDVVSQPQRWAGLRSLGMVESERHIGEQITREVRYFITTLPQNAEQLARSVRAHWAIENQLHWTLDISFREDESRLRRDNAAANFGVFRHIALNALRQEKTDKKGIKAKRFRASLEPDYAEKVASAIF
jgi:predicted transposase YbfD/YdcC